MWFVQVQEAAASQSSFVKIPRVCVDLTNLHLGFGNFDSAMKLYLNAISRFYQHHSPAL